MTYTADLPAVCLFFLRSQLSLLALTEVVYKKLDHFVCGFHDI